MIFYREQNISRALELAQFRISQLVAEMEANKEAQSIVLETKESVMRSLAKQNSHLTIEVCMQILYRKFCIFFYLTVSTCFREIS
jgi:hypothetical protein